MRLAGSHPGRRSGRLRRLRGGRRRPPDAGADAGAPLDAGPPTPGARLNPIAVGFELHAVIHDDGTLHPQQLADGTALPPYLLLAFADLEYFRAFDEESRVGHFCVVGVDLRAAVPHDSSSPAFVPHDGATLNWSTELYLDFTERYELPGTECGPLLDPEVWGAEGRDLLAAFQGAHVGIGVGPMTDYQWEAYGGRDTVDPQLRDKPMAEYIALNDRDGHWGGCDWSSLVLYELEDAEDVGREDPANPGNLIMMPTDGLGAGPLPRALVRSFRWWGQDFSSISRTSAPPWDFGHLGDPPVPGAPLCGR